MNKLLYTLLCFIILGCSCQSRIEKEQNSRNKVIDIKKQIQEIAIDSPLIGKHSHPYVIDNYLIIRDYQSHDNLIHLFDKETFAYLKGTGRAGEGPNEIATIGAVVIDEKKGKFYVSDHGKQKILSYDVDSLLATPNYLPSLKAKIDRVQFPDGYFYVNDTFCIAKGIAVKEGEYFQQTLMKWNMKTGEMSTLTKSHPNVERKRFLFAVSLEDDLIVECYLHHDLMTISNLQGDTQYNIYGPKWDSRTSNEMIYFDGVLICKDKIIASYSGGHNWTDEQYSTRFIVFNLEGDYIKTLDVGYKIVYSCYDKDNHRIIMSFEDDIQFGYIDLEGII